MNFNCLFRRRNSRWPLSLLVQSCPSKQYVFIPLKIPSTTNTLFYINAVRWWQNSGISVFLWWNTWTLFSDDCSEKYSGRSSKYVWVCQHYVDWILFDIGLLCIMWKIPHVTSFCSPRCTRRRRLGLSLRTRRTSRLSPACVWPALMLVSSASAPREPKTLPIRTWKKRSKNGLYGTLQNKALKRSMCVVNMNSF